MIVPRTHALKAQQGESFRSKLDPQDDPFRDILAEKLADEMFELEMALLRKYNLEKYYHNP